MGLVDVEEGGVGGWRREWRGEGGEGEGLQIVYGEGGGGVVNFNFFCPLFLFCFVCHCALRKSCDV